MFSSLRDRFGTAGLVVAIMALVVALVGTAYAASTLTKGQKKEVEKIAKKYAGKNGAPGAPGAKGDTGPSGTNGSNGTNGKDGTNGTNGKSVVVGTATAVECPEGGATVEVAGEPATKKKVCNGEEGPEGPEGSPWTAGGTLPSGATETGSWAGVTQKVAILGQEFNAIVAPISIPIPLPADAVRHFNEPETEECPGNAEEPAAKEGNLCIYLAHPTEAEVETAVTFGSGGSGFSGSSKTGAALLIATEGSAGEAAWGTFAVTG